MALLDILNLIVVLCTEQQVVMVVESKCDYLHHKSQHRDIDQTRIISHQRIKQARLAI